jgi:ribose transport system permease protein
MVIKGAETPSPVSATAQSEASTGLRRAGRILVHYAMVWVLIVLVVVASVAYEGFLAPDNLRNMLTQNAPVGLVAIGMTFVIITGGFDLSVGAMFALGAVVYGSLEGALPWWQALLVAIVVGALAGGLNGILITKAGINPFVATLGTASVFSGAASLYTNAQAEILTTDEFRFVGTQSVFGVRISIWILVLSFIVGAIVLAKTVYGRSIYALGGSSEAARLVGIKVDILRASTYVLVGMCAALAGLITTSQIGTAQPDYGANIALDAISIVVIGGTSLLGGEGALWRTGVGLLTLSIINNVFQSQAVDPAVQSVVKGTIVVTVVGLAEIARRRRSAR